MTPKNQIQVYKDAQALATPRERVTVIDEPYEIIIGETYQPKASHNVSGVRETYIERTTETHHHHYYGKEKPDGDANNGVSDAELYFFILMPSAILFMLGVLFGGLLGR